MPFSLLLTTSGLCACYDNEADILLLDLQGYLTLATIQLLEKEVVQLAMPRPYTQVILRTYYLNGLAPTAQQRFQQAPASGCWGCKS